jgi:hypothetical protein
MRIKIQKREAATYIILRRKGISINQLSLSFGRSTSFIFRVLKAAHVRFMDLRKLPTYVKSLGSLRSKKIMEKLVAAWEAFMLGETDKPP